MDKAPFFAALPGESIERNRLGISNLRPDAEIGGGFGRSIIWEILIVAVVVGLLVTTTVNAAPVTLAQPDAIATLAMNATPIALAKPYITAALAARDAPLLNLSPSSGRGGDMVTVTGSSFNVSGIVSAPPAATIWFNDEVVKSNVWFNGSGFTTSFIVPSNTAPGLYKVSAIARQDFAEATFTVTDIAPQVFIDANPQSGGAPLSVHLSGARSFDEDGSISSYRWDFGDGESATGVAVDHTYTRPGDYRATLTVTDDQGRPGTAYTIIGVGNTPPVAAVSANPTSGSAPLNVDFDGSQSHDPDGTDLTFFWDFGDGAFGSDVTTEHTYQKEGVYQLSLTVTDPYGASDRAEATIEVERQFPWWLVIGGLGVAAGAVVIRRYIRPPVIKATELKFPEPPVHIGVQSGVECSAGTDGEDAKLTDISVDIRSGIWKEGGEI